LAVDFGARSVRPDEQGGSCGVFASVVLCIGTRRMDMRYRKIVVRPLRVSNIVVCNEINVIHYRAAHTTELRIRAKTQPLFLPPPMPPPPDMELLSREDRIVLAVDLLKSDASLSVRSVAARFCIPESTLQSRRARTPARRDIYPNSSKLTKSEEDSLVRRIRNLSLHGFAPPYSQVRSMAD
jgi:hypothetical protein